MLISLFYLVIRDSSKFIGYPPKIKIIITRPFNSLCWILAFSNFETNSLVCFAKSFVDGNEIRLGQSDFNTVNAFSKPFHQFGKSDLEILDLSLQQNLSLLYCGQGTFRIVVTVRLHFVNFLQIVVDILRTELRIKLLYNWHLRFIVLYHRVNFLEDLGHKFFSVVVFIYSALKGIIELLYVRDQLLCWIWLLTVWQYFRHRSWLQACGFHQVLKAFVKIYEGWWVRAYGETHLCMWGNKGDWPHTLCWGRSWESTCYGQHPVYSNDQRDCCWSALMVSDILFIKDFCIEGHMSQFLFN